MRVDTVADWSPGDNVVKIDKNSTKDKSKL